MDPGSELNSTLGGGSRVIVIAERDVDLRGGTPENTLFLLKIAEGSLAAGGRGGGFGERRVVGVALFELRGGAWTKKFETGEGGGAAGFEVPYYVSRLPIFLADGAEAMGYGVVDPDLVREFLAKSVSLSLLK